MRLPETPETLGPSPPAFFQAKAMRGVQAQPRQDQHPVDVDINQMGLASLR